MDEWGILFHGLQPKEKILGKSQRLSGMCKNWKILERLRGHFFFLHSSNHCFLYQTTTLEVLLDNNI